MPLLLAGCATYHPLPLPKQANLSRPDTANHTSIPTRLSMHQAAALALARDPALAAARAQVRVARAQAYDAGLLPDPGLSLSLTHPLYGGTAADHHNAWSAGLTESLVGLITHGEKHKAASAQYAEKLLAWHWQAQQVALKAETTWLQTWAAQREVAALQRESSSAQSLLAAAHRAHAAGALSATMYRQALVQAATLRTRLQTASDHEIQVASRLADLLRVQAGHDWHLAAPAPFTSPAPSSVTKALTELPKNRLDLQALQAGYRGANAHLRAAILAQFPVLDIGFTRASDNTGVNSVGFGITLRLPVFNGNRGKIAMARATRKALNTAYQARLDTASNQVRAVASRLRLAQDQLDAIRTKLPALQQASQAMQEALARHDATRFDAWTALSAWLDARIDADKLQARTTRLALTLRVLLAEPATDHPATEHGTSA